MQKTVLYDRHIALGAKMTEFAGFTMPVEYTGINAEHMAVREAAGMFDVSHMGEFRVRGKNALAFLQHICSNDISQLKPGRAQYNCLPNESGGIVDDLIVYMIAENDYLAVVNAGNIEKDWNWFESHNKVGAELENASNDYALLAVQGPRATSILQRISSPDLSSIPYYSFAFGNLNGIDNVIFSNTGYTGSGGFELYLKTEDASKAWDMILEAGKADGLIPAGLGARDTLRLEMGFCLYGNDISDTTSPLEGGLAWITKFIPGKDFIGRSAIEAQKINGVERRLKGFVLEERGIPRTHYELVNEKGEQIGEVTSGTMSPVLKKGIGLGYLKRGYWDEGSVIYVSIRGKKLRAIVTKTPFI
jgi:aminomethyltransferase